MKNIHITLTDFRNDSRILKEVASLEASNIFSDITVIALGANDLPVDQNLSPKIKVLRIKLKTKKLPKTKIFQIIKLLEFILKSFFYVGQKKVQVVNIHALALLPLGWFLKKIYKISLVYDAHELETETNGLKGFHQKLSKWVEKRFIKSCDLIVVVGESIADWYVNAYGIRRPLVVKNAPRFRSQKKGNLIREILGILPEQKIFLYQGALMRGRGINIILDAFMVRKKNNVVAVFMGYGHLASEVMEASKVCKNIYLLPAVPPELVLDYTSSADVGISIIENTCLSYYYCMPNKFFEYAMASLPVIVSDMKEMGNALESANFGLVLSDFSSSSLNTAIDDLCARNLTELSNNAFLFAQTNAWEKQEEKMIKAYSKMLYK